jgi:hypothetical protein
MDASVHTTLCRAEGSWFLAFIQRITHFTPSVSTVVSTAHRQGEGRQPFQAIGTKHHNTTPPQRLRLNKEAACVFLGGGGGI